MIPNGFTIDSLARSRHTFRDLGMIPKSKIVIAPAKPKFIKFSVPGADGDMDLSEALTGSMHYSNRKGTIDFIVFNGTDYMQAYVNCLIVFNGERKAMVLDDDPDTTYVGRFWVNEWKSKKAMSQITIEYDIDP